LNGPDISSGVVALDIWNETMATIMMTSSLV
jgi:hypothetical protein